MALTQKQAAMPTVAMRMPPSAGPMMRDRLKLPELRAMALPRSSRPTSSTTSAERVGLSTAMKTPWIKDKT